MTMKKKGKGNPHYRKGANNERQLVNHYRRKGWLAFRSAGSHSPVDVVAMNSSPGEIYLIQVKGKRQKIKMPWLPEYLTVYQKGACKEKGKWVMWEGKTKEE